MAEGHEGWDEYAPFYDWENARTLGRRDVPFWRTLALQSDGPVLELGCGTGRISIPLARAGVSVVGIDRSDAMLARARQRIRRGRLRSYARLIRGDNASLASVELQNIVEETAKKLEIPIGQRNMSTAKKHDQFFNEITMTLSFESTPNQATMFLSEIRNASKFITVRNAQIAPVQIFQEAPKKGDFQKTVRVSLTLAAVLASPTAPEKKG